MKSYPLKESRQLLKKPISEFCDEYNLANLRVHRFINQKLILLAPREDNTAKTEDFE